MNETAKSYFDDEIVEIVADKKLNVGPRKGAKTRRSLKYPDWTTERILELADAHHERTGKWPKDNSGQIVEAPGETWAGVAKALRRGFRGLEGGSSLARLLGEERSVRNHLHIPALTPEIIRFWAESHYVRNGWWPTCETGAISDAPGETWAAVELAIRERRRGMAAFHYRSLSHFLNETFGRTGKTTRPYRKPSFAEKALLKPPKVPKPPRVRKEKPPKVVRIKPPPKPKPPRVQRYPAWTIDQILETADAYHRRHGSWPNETSGLTGGTLQSSWKIVSQSLKHGRRKLPGGSTLARLLSDHRGVQESRPLPGFTTEQILRLADSYFQKTGNWPNTVSGSIFGLEPDTWQTVNIALRLGRRGLPGGSTLARLLAEHRSVRNFRRPGNLTLEIILEWAKAHHNRTGKWPWSKSGPVFEVPGEKWANIGAVLARGGRGLPGGISLARLLQERLGARYRGDWEKISVEQILEWADRFHSTTGGWPMENSGIASHAPFISWKQVSNSLKSGTRGLPGGSSLAKLLEQCRGKRNKKHAPRLSVDDIADWARWHRDRNGKLPTETSGVIEDAPGETWVAVALALRRGGRGLEGCGYRSLTHLLDEKFARNG